MHYRPREKRRHPAVTFLLFIMLVAFSAVLVALLGIYAGYFEVEVPTMAQRFGPTPTPTRPAPLYIADGDEFFAQGKLNQAIEAYEQAIQIDPANDVPYIRQSRLLIYTGNTSKALERAEQAILLNPASAENMAYYCRALDWEAQYGAAFNACSCAIELDPAYAEGYAFLAEVYADQGDWISAVNTAQQAIDTNFQSMDAHHNMGYVREIQGRYQDAVKFYENAINLAPNLAPLYVAAGRSYYWLGNFALAEERFKQAIRLNPTSAEAYDRLGWTYHTNGEPTRAIDALEQGLGVDPSFDRAWGHLGLVYYTRQNFETAIEYLPKAIELSENKFLQRARQVEIHAQVQTLTGPETILILRGRFSTPQQGSEPLYVAQLQPIQYQPVEPEIADEASDAPACVAEIMQSIKSPGLTQLSPTESLEFTQAFSQTGGTATLNLTTGNLLLDVNNMPYPQDTPYEVKVRFWPNRVDSVGYAQPDGNQKIQANIQFEERLSAPIEYYYTLGLAYAYLDLCDQAVPWLLTALEKDSSAYNPAWAGLRECPTAQAPPTPIPTPTPLPEAGE